MKRAIWTGRAQADLDEADDCWHGVNPDFAAKPRRQAFTAAIFLADRPSAGAAFGGGTRKRRIKGTDYLLIYRTVSGGVEILRLRHAHQNRRTDP